MGKAAFKQTDVTRALRAGAAAGIEVAVRIDRLTGDLIILPAHLTAGIKEALPSSDPQDLLDGWLAEHGDD